MAWRAAYRQGAAVLVAACGSAWAGVNTPPNAPAALQPSPDRVINPANFLVESGPFSDADPGDLHLCTDWEIWNAARTERVWSLLCVGGVERIRAALSNGTFENSLAGRASLDAETDYVFRLRHRDDSGDPATEWSAWTEQAFTTAQARALFPLELSDVLDGSAPTLRDGNGASLTLAVGASVRVESAAGEELLTIAGGAGVNNPGALGAPAAVRVVIAAGPAGLLLPASDLMVVGGGAEEATIYLPAVDLAAGASAAFWVAFNGSTYVAGSGQSEPDFSAFARGAPVSWRTAPGWQIDLAATGFSLPVAIEFVTNPGPEADAPLYYVAELYGTIRVVLRNGEVRTFASGLLNFNPNGEFPGAGEQGLGDLAYDPVTGDLFMTYLYSEVDGVDFAPHFPAVDRFTSNDGGRTAATRTRILDMPGETQGQAHYISSLNFGPDDLLYVHMGDGFVPETALNLNSFRGKILRLDRNGAAASGNPFYNAGNGITARDYIFAYGLRNPFGGAWRFGDQGLYFVENGPSVDRFGRADFGENFGYDGSDQSMFTGALFNWVPSVAPVNIGFVQPETFGGSGFPAEFFGRAYVSQFGGTFAIGPGDARLKSITEWQIDANGALVAGPTPIAIYNGTGASSPVALAVGPDGVYFSDFFAEFAFGNPTQPDANIYRLSWVGLPPPPDCDNNGVPDAEEIAAGTVADCNGNGRPDACDIASAASADCNGNGVPDECDVSVPVLADFNAALDTGWRLNGVATRQGGVVRLTTLDGFVIGSLTRTPVSADPMERLDVSFDFRTGGGSGADGFAFAAYDASVYSGMEAFSEEGPGSTNEAPAGPGTLVVSFDTFDNFGEGENVIKLSVNGVRVATAVPSFDLEDFTWRRARVVLLDGRVSLSISTPGGPVETIFAGVPATGYTPFVARLGLSGRTGGLTNFHDIDNVTILVPGPGDADGNGVPDACDACNAADLATAFGVLDVNDVLVFALAFNASSAAADLWPAGGNGTYDINDILEFAAAFSAGCP